MALNQGYNAILVWDTDHTLQVKADITMDVSRGRIDVTVHGGSSLPFRKFESGLFDPIEITVPILFDYSRAETAEFAQKMICGTNTRLEFKDAAGTTNAHIDGNAKVMEIAASGRMENEMQINNVTFLFSGAPTTLYGETI